MTSEPGPRRIQRLNLLLTTVILAAVAGSYLSVW